MYQQNNRIINSQPNVNNIHHKAKKQQQKDTDADIVLFTTTRMISKLNFHFQLNCNPIYQLSKTVILEFIVHDVVFMHFDVDNIVRSQWD